MILNHQKPAIIFLKDILINQLNQLEPVGTSEDQMGPIRTNWDQLEPVGTSLDQLRPDGTN